MEELHLLKTYPKQLKNLSENELRQEYFLEKHRKNFCRKCNNNVWRDAMQFFEKMSKQKKAGILVYLFAMLVLFYSYFYADFYETGLEGVRFWDILFAGNIRAFYKQIFLIGNIQYVPLYDFPMYIIFAIWNLPLWIVEKLTHIDIFHSALCLSWMKSLMLFFSWVFIKTFNTMMDELGIDKEDKKTGIIMFFTSAFYMSGLVVLSQYDIISLALTMLGITFYLRDDQKKFLLVFSFVAPLKYFGLLVFVPLLLLREKNIGIIIGKMICVMIPCAFFWVMFPYGRPELVDGCVFSPSSSGTNVAKPVYMDLFDRGNIAFGILFLFIFGEILFLFWCYMYHEKEVWKNGRLVMYCGFIAFFIQFTLAYSHPYWQLLMVPYIVCLILLNKKYQYINLLMETIMSAAFVFAQIFFFTWCYKAEIVNFSFWKFVLKPGKGTGHSAVTLLRNFIADARLQNYAVGIGLSVYTALILIFAIINCPMIKKDFPLTAKGEDLPKWLLPVRAAITVIIGLVPIVLYFMSWSGGYMYR